MNFNGRIRLIVFDFISGLNVRKSLDEIHALSGIEVDELAKISETGYRNLKLHVDGDPILRSYYNSLPNEPRSKKHFKDLFNILSISGKGVYLKKTSGSTGEPFKYYASMKSQSYLWAGIFYSWLMAGYKFGEKVAFLSGSALVENKSLKKKLFYKFFNFIVFDINNNPISFKKDFISYAKKNNVSIVYGYAGVIFDVARELESFDDFLDCKSVVTTAEQLTPAMRALIEFRFNCKVFNQYGCNDAGLSAFECHLHNGFHYLSNRAYVKVVNGRLISTDNFNSSMPMIDYDTGDLAILSMEPCSCGLSFPLIKEIVGRQNDIVVSPAGHFHSSFFTQFFLDYKSIIRYQVIAKGGGHVLLKLDSLDVGENFRDVIANRLNSLMNVSVEIEFTSSFLSRSNGKVPVVVNVE